jgi:hypothetical protein
MVGMRLAFFVIVAAMVIFGEFPIADPVANSEVIGCALALLALGVLYVATEYYYVKIGRGTSRSTVLKEKE